MSHVQRFDHVGITVADLDTVTAFFTGLGLDVENRCSSRASMPPPKLPFGQAFEHAADSVRDGIPER
jgi:catechol 2,3-dioxygenase-like lactoylglutathione lyase family enzyme